MKINEIPFFSVGGLTPERLAEVPAIASEATGNAVLFPAMAAAQHDELLELHKRLHRDGWNVEADNRKKLNIELSQLGWDIQGFMDFQPSPTTNWPNDAYGSRVASELITARQAIVIPQMKAWHTDVLAHQKTQGIYQDVILPHGWLISINLAASVTFLVSAETTSYPDFGHKIHQNEARKLDHFGYNVKGPSNRHVVRMRKGDVIAVRQPAQHAVRPQFWPFPGMRRAFTLTREDAFYVEGIPA